MQEQMCVCVCVCESASIFGTPTQKAKQ